MFRQAFSGNNDEADVAETVRYCAEPRCGAGSTPLRGSGSPPDHSGV